MRYRIILFLAFLVVGLDQSSKWLAAELIAPHQVIPLADFFNLVRVYNFGAAFGLLNDPFSSWQRWFLAGMTILAIAAIMGVAKLAEEKEKKLFLALGLVLGGALGNLIDRLHTGAVLDFLDLHYAGWHWPAFNVADIAICAGASLLALCIFKKG